MIVQKNTSNPLHLIIEEIKSLTECHRGQVSEIIKNSGIEAKDLLPHAYFDHSPEISYGRKIIFKNHQIIVLAVSWAPGDFSAIHSHGDTEWGVLYFFGDCEHRLYEEKGNSLRLVKKSIIPEGSIIAIEGEYIHAMGNLSDKPFQSLHVYFTGIEGKTPGNGARIFLLERKKVYTTTGAAYLDMDFNENSENAVEIDFDPDTLRDYASFIRPFFQRNNKTQLPDSIDFD